MNGFRSSVRKSGCFAVYALIIEMALGGTALADLQLPAIMDPAVIQQQSEQQRQRMEREFRSHPESPSQLLDTKALEKPDAGSVPAIRFVLQRVEFTASEILDKESLAAIAREFEGKEASFTDLQSLVAKVNALYRAKGAVAAEAVIPPQDVSTGVVKIRLVEGRIGRYNIEGNASTRDSYVFSRMHQLSGALLETRQLEQDLIRFNRTNDAQLQAELRSGEAFGTTDVFLKMVEPPRQVVRLFGDNAGSISTGERRAGAIYENRSLFGYRDDLSVAYTGATGHTGQSLNYSFPINTWGGRAALGYEDDRTKIKSGFLSSLGINGTATAWTGTLRQPVFLDADQQLDVTLGANSRVSTSSVGDTFLQRVDAFDTVLGSDYHRVDNLGSWAANLNLTSGHATSSAPSRLGYFLWKGYVRRDQIFAGGYSGVVNIAWQGANKDLLPSTAQYFIGGAGSVRGYSTAAYGGARGYAGNFELHHALTANAGGNAADQGERSASGFVFFDQGETRPTGPGQTPIRLASIGAGVDAALDRKYTFHLTLGQQLRQRSEEPRSYRFDVTLVAEAF